MNRKNVKNKIIIVLVVLLCIIGKIEVVNGYDISNYMNIHNTDNINTYLSYMTTDKSRFIRNTVGLPVNSGSDWSYVTQNPRVWCLAENQINSYTTGLLSVAGIIEIGKNSDPTYTKIYSAKRSGSNNYTIYDDVDGVSFKRVAKAAFTMMAGKNASTDHITGIAQYNFYNTFEDVLEKDSILKRFDYGSSSGKTSQTLSIKYEDGTNSSTNLRVDDYATNLKNIKKPIDVSNCEWECNTHDSDKKNSNGYTYKTKLENSNTAESNIIRLSNDNNLVTKRTMIVTLNNGNKVTYNINKSGEDWNLYKDATNKGRIYCKSGNIFFKDKLDITNVEISIEFRYIHGILYMLGGSAQQMRGISIGRWQTCTYSSTKKIKQTNNEVDVSLQKYIVSVNGKQVNENGDILSGNGKSTLRANMKRTDDEKNTSVIREEDKTYKNINKNVSVKDSYKGNKKIKVEIGDEVTYRIYIYNNTSNKADDIIIYDLIPCYGIRDEKDTIIDYESAGTITKITQGNSDSDIKSNWNKKNSNEGKRIWYYTLESLNANSNTYFDITIKLNKKCDGYLTNTAWVHCKGNKKTYRTLDSDYVDIESNGYSVSLEKYITQVNGVNVSLNGGTRQGYRYNDDEKLADGDKNKNKEKLENQVLLEPGDKVTYTIKLTNLGNKPVKVTQIYDSFTCYTGDENTGVKLVYDRTYGIQGKYANGNDLDAYDGEIINEYYGDKGIDDDKNWYEDKYKHIDIYLIAFDNASLISTGSSVYITIKFNVEIPFNLSGSSYVLSNKAGIVRIKNKNDISVTDSDGTDDNFDMDWVKTKTYSVSLEKYVSKVNGADVYLNDNKDTREGHRYNEASTNTEFENGKNADKEKYNSPVPVEQGDKVTFTIKLTNEGDNPVRITQFYDTFGYSGSKGYKNSDGTKNVGLKWLDNNISIHNESKNIINEVCLSNSEYGTQHERFNRYLLNIKYKGEKYIEAHQSLYIDITFEVKMPENITDSQKILFNKAGIVETSLRNKNDKIVSDSNGKSDNYDMDRVKTKVYAVSLEKYVSAVNGIGVKPSRAGKAEYIDTTKWKYNNPYTVSSGDTVTYTIKVKNNGEANVKVTEILDHVPDGATWYGEEITSTFNGAEYNKQTDNTLHIHERGITLLKKDGKEEDGKQDSTFLEPGDSMVITRNIMVLEDNMSLNILWNVAEIDEIKNKNDLVVNDSTPNDNKDADYIQLNYGEDKFTDYSVIKEWATNGYERPSSVTVKLLKMKGRTEIDLGMESITLADSNAWSYKWSNLPILEDGWVYIVRELNESGTELLPGGGKYNNNITVTYNDNSKNKITTITNTIESASYTNYSVEKVWKGDENEVEKRPDSIKVYLFNNNGTKVGETTLNSSNGWKDTWDNLNNSYTYYARELDGETVLAEGQELENNYKVSYEDLSNKTIIKNTTTSTNTASYSVEKKWEDNENKLEKRPASIKVYLFNSNGTKIDEVALNSGNDWKYEWNNLDYNESYYVREINGRAILEDGQKFENDYKVKYEESASKTIIINTIEEQRFTTYSVEKKWEDDENVAGKRPASIKVYLFNNNGTVVDEVTLNSRNNWKYEWNNLNADYDYYARELNGEKVLTEGQKLENNYAVSYKYTSNKTTITNTLETEDHTKFSVIKVWDDNYNEANKRPNSITVYLLNNDGEKVGETTLNSENSWRHTWDNLDSNKKYHVREISGRTILEAGQKLENNYEVSYEDLSDRTIITNTIENQGFTTYSVEKVWYDNNNKANKRPTSINVYLFNSDDEKVGEVILNNENNWKYTWRNLNEDYNYYVRELNGRIVLTEGQKLGNNYEVSYEDLSNETIIKNKLIQKSTTYSVEKKWVDNNNSASKRPESIDVYLFNSSGTKVGEVTLNNDNKWKYTWNNLDDNYEYYARELNGRNILTEGEKLENNYTVSYKDSSNKTTITNTIIPPPSEDISYSVEKVWYDNYNKANERPISIKVRLFKIVNSIQTKVGDVTLTNSNWTYTWNNLDKYDSDGNLIQYIAKELKGSSLLNDGDKLNDNYTVSYIHDTNKTIIYNAMSDDDGSKAIISGMVWNDMALIKTNNIYNGLKDNSEKYLSGIKVMLYRSKYMYNQNYDDTQTNIKDEKEFDAVQNYNYGVVAVTTTDENGKYFFTDKSLSTSQITLQDNEKYIKGPKVKDTTRWEGKYYSYYIVFEYNGITYTSTTFELAKDSDNTLDSNAKEDYGIINNSELSKIYNLNTREEFNSKFSSVDGNHVYDDEGNETCKLEYTTVNKDGYIPQSIYKYNSKMAIQACTGHIYLNNPDYKISEKKLKHINLGLRGRDVFDLELTSDVYSTKVTVNNVSGDYTYNSNKVTVRRNDLNNYNYREDSANIYAQSSKYEGDSYEQIVRQSDITNDAYDNTGLEIEVTYRIKVKNASNTAGTATKVTNYYDSKYNVNTDRSKIAYYYENESSKNKDKKTWINENNISLNIDENNTRNYNFIEITTPGTQLNQSDTMEIYVVYKLNDAVNTLKDVNKLATYNMAEITAYKTATTGDKYTKGLLDKDSAPGSAATEKVRLAPNLIGNDSTLNYYFGGNNLSKLKYEDDTYATPTLYFVKDDSSRKITGTVFEDKTITNQSTRIKTGNGIMDSNEVGVYGATVQLIEKLESDEKIRYETTTNSNGEYVFSGFLPGNYIIRYYYGDTTNTVLLNQKSHGINGKSYNGEDFQATNNKYKIDGMDTNQLITTDNDWYLDNENEGISTATDDSSRRSTVSKNVTDFSDEKMTALNNIRDGKTETESTINTIIEETKMWANTASMLFTVEKAGIKNFKDYTITKMNFGIAEVPVTTVELSKSLNKFTITDSTGQNVLASYEPGRIVGNVIAPDLNNNGSYWVQIEDEKLQGAKLEITYNINLNMETERNFDNTASIVPTITGIVDFIDNNLSYNSELGNNNENWEVTTNVDTLNTLKGMQYKEGSVPKGTVDPDGIKYTTIVKAKANNPLLLTNTGTATATITLEKVLSSTNSTIEEIITSTVDSYEYSNIIEIIGFNYKNNTTEENPSSGETPSGTPTSDNTIMRDRVRTKDRYIILPGVQYDTAISEELIITPPTGDSSISITYYIIAVIGLAVLAVGVYGIKKYVIKK